MQEIESRAESLVMNVVQKLGTRVAEARSRQAPIWASISGQYICCVWIRVFLAGCRISGRIIQHALLGDPAFSCRIPDIFTDNPAMPDIRPNPIKNVPDNLGLQVPWVGQDRNGCRYLSGQIKCPPLQKVSFLFFWFYSNCSEIKRSNYYWMQSDCI